MQNIATYALRVLRAYRNKVTNKLWGVVHMPAKGKKRGYVLLSFLTEPFTKAPWEYFSDPHTNPWACHTLAEMLAERGYAVDIINWNDERFVPHQPYRLCLDIQKNLERLAPLLPHDCTKVHFVVSAYAEFQNAAEQARLDAIKKRRGITLPMHRKEAPTRSPAFADYLAGYGNSTIFATYAEFNKPAVRIPAPVMATFPFPEHKDWEQARHEFMWFGGGGAALKGLDLVLEALAFGPYTLHVIGPAAYEKDFAEAYKKELSASNVHVYPRMRVDRTGRLTIGEHEFMDIFNRCAAVVAPSASEGGGAATIQAMHAALIPLATRTSGMPDDAPAVFVEPTVEAIRAEVERIAATSPEELRTLAHAVWDYAQARHTQEQFKAQWTKFFDSIGL